MKEHSGTRIASSAEAAIADTEADYKVAIAFFNPIGFSPSRQDLWLTKTLPRPAKKDTV